MNEKHHSTKTRNEKDDMATPICPTCKSALPEETELQYFCAASATVLRADDVSSRYEEVARLVRFLGAFAEAAPAAVANRSEVHEEHDDKWIGALCWLAEELRDETERRLYRLMEAGLQWEKRAAGKPSATACTHRKED